jgi:hypothetical protein
LNKNLLLFPALAQVNGNFPGLHTILKMACNPVLLFHLNYVKIQIFPGIFTTHATIPNFLTLNHLHLNRSFIIEVVWWNKPI